MEPNKGPGNLRALLSRMINFLVFACVRVRENKEACGLERNKAMFVGLSSYLNEEVTDASEAVCDARLILPQPVVVGNADVVHVFEELVFLGKN